HFQIQQIDFDEVGQVFRQATYFHFSQVAEHHATFLLDANAGFFVGEVQLYVNGDLLTGDDALEVSVHQARLGRVALQSLDQYFLNLAINGQADDRGVERLIFQRLVQFTSGDGNALRLLAATVNDGRYQISVTTQAAARTF